MKTGILVGDIGGTHTRLALAQHAGSQVRLSDQAYFSNAEHGSLVEIIRKFLTGKIPPKEACLAVAGPTDGRRVSFTNLDWQVDAEELKIALGLLRVVLVNDFLAVGHVLGSLPDSELITLQDGEALAHATSLAIGAGTGLGVVLSVRAGERPQPLASEGGHIAFAPANDEQASLLRFLQETHGRVSVERILSGPGISALYGYCRAASGRPLKRARPAPEITDAARQGRDPTAIWALKLFARIYGQTAGDLALVAMARGGVYLAGGIAPKILPFLQGEDFLNGFRDKGRFSAWMESVPVHVITTPDVGLKGAALALD